ncbi:MAG: hypothetical protein K9G71_01405 [Rhodobacteraceae bacterium]|nr:hypothetical protein [Paracoccaceae bacterium]MCF8512984.1 hypothetical protein [Paracoccaceae bacterium]MCF8517229.1 hypothetical protein [Paracoccaceae bacterium]
MNDVSLPGLIVPIEARIDKLEKGLKRAAQVQARSAATMEQRAKQSATRMAQSYEQAGSGIATAMARFAAPLAGVLVADTLINIGRAARQTVGAMARVGDEAKRAGVGVQAFQEWSFVADQNRISVDALIDGMKELNLRADEFIVTGAGSGAEAFVRLGFSATDLEAKLKDPSELLLEIMGRLEELDRAAQIRVADEIFGGTGGERFVELISQGEAGLRQTIARAHEVGAVMDSAIIEKASELDRKFNELGSRLQALWRGQIVEVGEFFGLIERERAKLEFVPQQVGRVVGNDLARQLEAQGAAGQEALGVVRSMEAEYRNLGREAQALAMQLADASNMLRGLGQVAQADALQSLAQRMAKAAGEFDAGVISGEQFAETLGDVTTEADTTISAMDDLDKASLSGVIGQVQGLLSWIQALPAAVAAARSEISTLEAPGMTSGTPLSGSADGLMPPTAPTVTTSPRPRPAPAMLGEPVRASSGGGGGGGGRDEWGSAVESIQAETQALQAEAAALIAVATSGERYSGAIEFARQKAELLVAAQRAGVQITPELTAKIDALARANVTAGASAEAAAKKLQSIEDFGKQSADTMADLFTGIVTGSMTAEDALKQLIAQLIKMAAQKFFLKLFGGSIGFASGGYTGDGGTFQPAGIVHKGEFVLSKKATSRLGVDNLNALHASALRGYSGGGAVGDVPRMHFSASESGKAQSIAQTVTVSAPVTVSGSAGTPDQNDDLARKIASQMENQMKLVFGNELRKQMRPGAMLNRG